MAKGERSSTHLQRCVKKRQAQSCFQVNLYSLSALRVRKSEDFASTILYTKFIALPAEGGRRPVAMEEVTEVAEVGILVVAMARSVVREVGGAMRVGFMVVEPMTMDEISVDLVREDYVQESIGFGCV